MVVAIASLRGSASVNAPDTSMMAVSPTSPCARVCVDGRDGATKMGHIGAAAHRAGHTGRTRMAWSREPPGYFVVATPARSAGGIRAAARHRRVRCPETPARFACGDDRRRGRGRPAGGEPMMALSTLTAYSAGLSSARGPRRQSWPPVDRTMKPPGCRHRTSRRKPFGWHEPGHRADIQRNGDHARADKHQWRKARAAIAAGHMPGRSHPILVREVETNRQSHPGPQERANDDAGDRNGSGNFPRTADVQSST